jgi:hypothetical protein
MLYETQSSTNFMFGVGGTDYSISTLSTAVADFKDTLAGTIGVRLDGTSFEERAPRSLTEDFVRLVLTGTAISAGSITLSFPTTYGIDDMNITAYCKEQIQVFSSLPEPEFDEPSEPSGSRIVEFVPTEVPTKIPNEAPSLECIESTDEFVLTFNDFETAADAQLWTNGEQKSDSFGNYLGGVSGATSVSNTFAVPTDATVVFVEYMLYETQSSTSFSFGVGGTDYSIATLSNTGWELENAMPVPGIGVTLDGQGVFGFAPRSKTKDFVRLELPGTAISAGSITLSFPTTYGIDNMNITAYCQEQGGGYAPGFIAASIAASMAGEGEPSGSPNVEIVAPGSPVMMIEDRRHLVGGDAPVCSGTEKLLVYDEVFEDDLEEITWSNGVLKSSSLFGNYLGGVVGATEIVKSINVPSQASIITLEFYVFELQETTNLRFRLGETWIDAATLHSDEIDFAELMLPEQNVVIVIDGEGSLEENPAETFVSVRIQGQGELIVDGTLTVGFTTGYGIDSVKISADCDPEAQLSQA